MTGINKDKEILSISDLTSLIKERLESNFSNITVEGEISNYTNHRSGHQYFSLKDQNATISCALFRNSGGRLGFKLEEGLSVFATGNVSVYPPRGNYQFIVNSMEPAGIGALQLAYEQLKKKLSEEGLFSREKKPFPMIPQTIGIVTSPTGAALQDMLNILARRFPDIPVIVFPALVQGEGSADSVVTAIEQASLFEWVDVLIVGRGGGSMEDLWTFNEERVVRAIASCPKPVISAVGHEVDFTLADFVADLRAPTPSAAAELVVQPKINFVNEIDSLMNSLREKLINKFENKKTLLDTYSPNRLKNILVAQINLAQQQTDMYHGRLVNTMNFQFSHFKEKAVQQFNKLKILDPNNTLKRGFTIAFDEKGENIGSIKQCRVDDHITLKFTDGSTKVKILKINKE